MADAARDTFQPGTGAADLGKAEDAVHASGDLGVMALVVRKDAATGLSNTDGDYTPLQVDANGYLRVNVAAGSATGTEFAEDAAHVSGDKGTLVLVVRKDAAGSLVGADGDYAPLQVDANGYLKTIVSGGIAITEFAEDTPHVSADKGQLVFAVRKDVAAALAGTDGDYIPLTTDDTGRVRIAALPANSGVDIGDVDVLTEPATAADAAVGLPAVVKVIGGYDGANVQAVKTDAAGELQVDIVTLPALPAGANNIGDVDVLTLPALPAGANNIGDVDVLTLPAIPAGANKIGGVDLDSDATIAAAVPAAGQFIAGTDGTNARGLKTDTAGELQVDVLTLPAVDSELPAAAALADAAANPTTPTVGADLQVFNGTTWDRARGDITTGLDVDVTRVQGNVTVIGDVAHDAVDANNPQKIGGKAVTAIPAVVANNDRVDAYFDEYGKLHVTAGGISLPVNGTFTRPADTTAYAAGDAVTDSTTAPTVVTFTNCARANGLSGIISSAIMIDGAAQATKGQFELWLFDTTVTPDNDNAVFTPTDAECATLVGVIEFTTWFVGDATAGAGGNAVSIAKGQNFQFKCGAASRNLFGLLVVRNAYTPVSAEVFTFRLNIAQD